ncbi:exodeoxyribonuclease III [bacterium]|nr:exodeoxyribonuclease III [bacterium]
MKLMSWNVNGLRAIMGKDFTGALKGMDADILAIQETKLQADQRTEEMLNMAGYESYWSYAATKKGYSGVAVFTRLKPEKVNTEMGIPEFDSEGRLVELTFKDFILFNVYFPNGQKNEERLQYKLDFYQHLFAYIRQYKEQNIPIIITGDFNTAHNEIDLKRPKQNENNSGFMRIERDWLDRIVDEGYVDTFRYLHPDTEKYSWWSYRFNARKNNTGWRIDYFFVTRNLIDRNWLTKAFIENDIFGSDHCPVGIELKLNA